MDNSKVKSRLQAVVSQLTSETEAYTATESAGSKFKMARSKAELEALSAIDPEIDAIRRSGKLKMPLMDWSDSHKAVLQMRQIMQAWEKLSPLEGVIDSTSSYTTRDGVQNRILVFRPAAVAGDQKLPLVVHFHGGGGAVGSPEGPSRFCQNLALKQNAVVVSAGYRLAPENPFPTGVDDSWECVQHLVNSGADALGADLGLGFVIGGHSNGAAIAAVIALRARDEGMSPRITGLYLGAAGLIDPGSVPKGYGDWFVSRKDEACVNAPILDPPTKKMFDDVYSPTPNSAWYRAGNYTGDAGFKDLPRTYFQVCGSDILRDDSLIFEDILRKSGVGTDLDIYPGCPHVFWSVFTMIGQYQKWAADTQRGFTWLLSGK